MKEVEVEFNYNGTKVIVQCNPNDKMKGIIKKFITKCNIENEIYLLYDGNTVNTELTYNEVANNYDKSRNHMNVIAKEEETEDELSSNLKKSKFILCPECNENSLISIKEFKITLYKCKNQHIKENIQFNEFDKTQYIDETKIKCNKCNKSKSETFGNQFFICFSCNYNICPLCKTVHDKSHYIIDYDQKDFICRTHKDPYVYYCNDCNNDICTLCEKGHNNHKIITYGSIMPDVDEVKKEVKDLNKIISELKNNFKDITKNNFVENLENFSKIYNDRIITFDIKKRNFYALQNLNVIKKYNKNLMKNISEIIKDKKISIDELPNKLLVKEREDNISTEIEENNNENSKKYNPSDDKYENFNLFSINQKFIYTTKYPNEDKVLILNDRRVLLYHNYKEGKEYINKICVYDLTNGFNCDIDYELDRYKEFEDVPTYVSNIYQMNDGNVIIVHDKEIKIFKIREKTFEKLQIFSFEETSYAYKIFGKKFLIKNLFEKDCRFYKYEKGKLEYDNKSFTIHNISDFIYDLHSINENEFVLLYDNENNNNSLLFYDMEKNKEIKELDLGGRSRIKDTCILKINKNILIVDINNEFLLIDIKNRNVIDKYKISNFVSPFKLSLNEKNFLVANNTDYKFYLYHLEIDNSNKIKIIDKIEIRKDISLDIIKMAKYPGNGLIFIKEHSISIFEKD